MFSADHSPQQVPVGINREVGNSTSIMEVRQQMYGLGLSVRLKVDPPCHSKTRSAQPTPELNPQLATIPMLPNQDRENLEELSSIYVASLPLPWRAQSVIDGNMEAHKAPLEPNGRAMPTKTAKVKKISLHGHNQKLKVSECRAAKIGSIATSQTINLTR
jgi:hypothetical protein